MHKHSNYARSIPTWQDDEVLAQSNPVQNTWYTVMDTTTDVLVHSVAFNIDTVNEDLEVRVTIDGVVLTGAQAAAVAGTIYQAYKNTTGQSLSVLSSAVNQALLGFYVPIPVRSVKVELRKTSANGAGDLDGRVTNAQY